MIFFRAINDIALNYFGPVFYIIPVVIYCLLKYKTRNNDFEEDSASFEKRAFALIFDIGLLYSLQIGMIYTLKSIENPPALPINLIVSAFSFFNMIILPTLTGCSIGKMILRIKIVKLGNKKVGFTDMLYREIVKSWFSLPLFYLGCFWMLIGKNHLTWHESVSDTRVITIPHKEETDNLDPETALNDDRPFTF